MKTNVLSFGEFFSEVKNKYPRMDFGGDKRPYRVIYRYLTSDMSFILDEDGDLATVKKWPSSNGAVSKKMSFQGMLDIAEHRAKSAMRACKTNFRMQCIEEDLEEIEMLRERFKTAGQIGRSQPLSSTYRVYTVGNKSVAVSGGRTNETYAWSDRIARMFQEDSLDLDAPRDTEDIDMLDEDDRRILANF